MWTSTRFWQKLLVWSEVQTGPWFSQSPIFYWRGYQGDKMIFWLLNTHITYNLTNVQLTQSNAILRFVARKYNKALLGRTEKEEAMADMMAEEAMDLRCLVYLVISTLHWDFHLRNAWIGLCYGPNFDKNKPGYVETLNKKLAQFSAFLGKKSW